VRVASQPYVGASITENTSATSAATAMTAPPTSSRGASGSADSGTNRSVPASATAASNTLSPKIERHEKTASRRPEASRPRMPAPPPTADQTLTARVRSEAGNVLVIVESVAGMTSAAPRPRTARSAISSVAEVAAIATAEPVPKMTRPTIKAIRRP
jgi:hypothetical protein